MTFADEMKEMIQKGKTEKAKHEQEGRDFETGWYDLRQTLIIPLCREAKAEFDGEGIASNVDHSNGSVQLQAKWLGRHNIFEYTLTFSPDQERRMVVYSSGMEGEEDESFSLDRLTKALVEERLKRFGYMVARGHGSTAATYAVL
jgi:hypothetical protein